ncbi:MAG: phenylacetate--CoA ligase family protein [Acidimicrobiia bacterium]
MAAIREEWLAAVTRHRHAPAQPDDDRYWSRRLETASRDELRAVQDDKLAIAVRYAHEHIPYYRRRLDGLGAAPGDVKTVDDLRLLPVTTKQDMADDLAEHPPWGTYTAVADDEWRERGWQVFATSGTTGTPRAFRYTSFDREMWTWANARAMYSMGFRAARDVALLAFGYGPHVWLWGVHYALNLMGIPIVTAGGLDTRMRARFIDQYQPTILACTPSYALFLATVMRELGLDPAASSVDFVFCAGEPGFGIPATRRRIEEAWGATMHEFYGCTEAAPAGGGYTCVAVTARKDVPVSTHLLEDCSIWETVDPKTFDTVPPGRPGLTVVTNLMSEASPQLRFLVGDSTTLTDEPCECGRTHVRALGGFHGRADDMLNVRGVTVFPSAIEDAVRRVELVGTEFQIEVAVERELDVLTVRVEPGDAVDGEHFPQVAQLVENEIVSRCELRPVVEVVPVGTLPRTEFKAKRVVDRRDPG